MKLPRFLIFLAGLLSSGFVLHADLASTVTNAIEEAQAKANRPSIIIIQCHDLAAGDLSCYGQTNYLTPNLDRLAKGGIRFTHYSGAFKGPVTTAMLLSGKTAAPALNGFNLAHRLQQNGYHTGLIGEWGLAGKPWQQGFDEFAGFLDDAAARNYYADHLWRYAPGAIVSNDGKHISAFEGREMIYPNMGGKKGRYIPDLLVKAMLNFIKANQPDDANHHRPFFLLVNLPAPRSAAAGRDVFPVPTDAPFSSESWPPAARDRAALISRLDDGMGQLRELLRKSQMTHDVAIFFSSSCAPKQFANTNLDFMLPTGDYRNAKTNVPPRLPMLACWPGTIPTNQVSNHPWTAANVAATALEMAALKPDAKLSGHSILPLLKGHPPADKPAASKP